ncbi:MAG: ribosome biogenesis/translation initiation ATPase RLI [Candidatus Woesearchaeota archaeon]
MLGNRIAIVDKTKCDPTRCAKECMKFDPVNRSGGEGFHLGEDGKATIAQEVTTEAHQICAKKCPFEAIKIVRLPQEASGKPIHQYGENGFRLYNLPIPIFGKVVGLLGRNGIGKSTAVKILSGLEHANLGEHTLKVDSPTYTHLIEHFKGSTAQKYFEQMRDGQITVAFKPQSINAIPKQFSGKVEELLHKITQDTDKIQNVCTRLQLDNFLSHDIQTLSGGELQRVAIAATVLKKANVYIFDEPSSFLDIKQRINVAKFIQELADEKTAVVVIEHDLILLDYMADFIHLIYGNQGAYGVISKVKTTKIGINMYLEGSLRDENIQFRQNKISFHQRVLRDEGERLRLTQYPAMQKKLGDFSLTVKEGDIEKHTVIGILGENGIGKSTFAKLISGVEKPDNTDNTTQVPLAYKPQYIDTTDDTLVQVYLQNAIDNYNTRLIKPLKLESLFTQELRQLSGGQLQIVNIVKCLSEDVELYVMDEPSAYLDTEQRLTVSKIIKDFMLETGRSALIIDHDLLFIDYLSHKIIVFDGEPAKHGAVTGPFDIQTGMNMFLKDLDLTFRRDEESHRPRANKFGSQMDQKQRSDNTYYYI